MGPSDKKSAREYSNEHYKNYSERIKENVKRYKETYPERVLETRLKTAKKNPTKINARRCVEAALISGALVKPHICSGCGCPDTKRRVEAHHADYSDPLNVIWLCPKCHWRMDERRRVEESGIEDASGRRIRRRFTDAEDEMIIKRYDVLGVTGLSELLGRNPHSIYTRRNWTKVPYRGKPADECPDTPRYKAIGNSMCVNVMRWIGVRIQEVDDELRTAQR